MTYLKSLFFRQRKRDEAMRVWVARKYPRDKEKTPGV